MRALITGGSGFVGRHLERHLLERGDEVVVVDLECDVTSLDALRAAVTSSQPDAIYHLAALAHVGESWTNPGRYLEVNVIGTSNVLQAARELDPEIGVLVVSSAEVYGIIAPDELPITEHQQVAPVTPYAASKAAAEQVVLQAAHGYGQRASVVRPFNHIGPGQAPTFAVPAFAQRIKAAKATGAGELVVGNLTARRDFTDVRDVVAAYRAIVVSSSFGEIFNVASGIDRSMAEVVAELESIAGVELEHVLDEALLRPSDIPVLRGDASKLQAATGWEPSISFEQTLTDVLEATSL
jgi:GDP-4-dehydro-6-deoxy-D-mannose reductase